MKATLLLSTLLLFFGFTSPPGTVPEVPNSESDSYNYAEDFIASMSNCELEKRFEVQFPELFSGVNHVNAHRDSRGIYYYAVYGVDQAGEATVDYFKTTEEEVLEERYNYIEMNENTMRNPFVRQVCREKTGPPWNAGNWCTPANSGWVCGFTDQWGRCIYF